MPPPPPAASAGTIGFRPPEGVDLLQRLRGQGTIRPAVDPGLAGGLRDWLEDGLAEAAAAVADGDGPVRVSKDALTGVLTCEAHQVARRTAPRVISEEMARGSLVDALFRQWVTTGRLDDPWADALGAVEVGGDPDGIAGFVAGLADERREALAEEIAEHGAGIVARWPVPSPMWLPRTQERVVVPLAGGRVVMSGVVDLAFGGPAGERASVCVCGAQIGSAAGRAPDRSPLLRPAGDAAQRGAALSDRHLLHPDGGTRRRGGERGRPPRCPAEGVGRFGQAVPVGGGDRTGPEPQRVVRLVFGPAAVPAGAESGRGPTRAPAGRRDTVDDGDLDLVPGGLVGEGGDEGDGGAER